MENPTDQPIDWVLEQAYEMISDLQLIYLGPNGLQVVQAGVDHPLNPALVPSRSPVFRHTAMRGRSTLYLRVRTTSPMTIGLHAHTPSGYTLSAERDLVLLWMFYGLMAGMLLFNLLVFAATRDWTFATYALTITGGSAFMAVHNGLAYRYLWPGAGVSSGQAMVLAGFIWAIGICLFTRVFLDTRRTSQVTDRLLAGMVYLSLGGLVVTLFGYFRVLEVLGGLVVIGLTLVMMITSSRLLHRGERAARFYLMACGLMMIGILAGLLEAVGVLPYNFWTAWGYQIGIALQAVLLSLALADRYNQLRHKTEETNLALEDQVRARTDKLHAAAQEILARAEELEVANRMLQDEIQEREHAEKQRMVLEEQLRQTQKLDALGRLAGGVAHDMNNLLASILGFGALVKEGLEPSGELADDVEQILLAAKRGGQLTRNLLGFARRGAYEKGPVALNEVVRQVERLLEPTAQRRVAIELCLDPDLLLVEGDADLLTHAIMNLGLNGVQAIDGDGRLTLATQNVTLADRAGEPGLPPGRYARLEVTDTGAGMEPEQLEHAFEPFYTTKPKGEGTGLGLGMVYGTIRQHGGAVTLQSIPGQGTVARLWLPAQEHESSEPSTPPEAPPEITELTGTVLVVDDEESILTVAERLLSGVGLRVLLARDGAEALGIWKTEGSVDLVILDMVMPVMDGVATFAQLKKRCPTLPVLLCTGFANKTDAEDLLRQGAAGLLLKPFDREGLLSAVVRALATREED